MIRILQVVTHMNRGGLETMLMNYYRHMDRNRVQFDFLVHRPFEADYDAEIRALEEKSTGFPASSPGAEPIGPNCGTFFVHTRTIGLCMCTRTA